MDRPRRWKHSTSENSVLYGRWRKMQDRCRTRPEYSHVEVCEEWLNWDIFFEWAIKSGFRPELTIERLDNRKGYCPENCCWADMRVQARNRCTTKLNMHKCEIIRKYCRSGSNQRTVARLFGVAKQTVSDVVRRKNWN